PGSAKSKEIDLGIWTARTCATSAAGADPVTCSQDYGSNVSLPALVSRIGRRTSMSRRSKVWILAVTGLAVSQAAASILLRPHFGLTCISNVTNCSLLLSGILGLLPTFLSSRGRTRLF